MLEQTVERMLADPEGSAFIQSFAGQWLNLRELYNHSVTAEYGVYEQARDHA